MDSTNNTTTTSGGSPTNNNNSNMACDTLLDALPAAQTIGCALPPGLSSPAAPSAALFDLAFRPPPSAAPGSTIGLSATTKGPGSSTISGRVEKERAERAGRMAAMKKRKAPELEKFLREKKRKAEEEAAREVEREVEEARRQGEEICLAALREIAADEAMARSNALLLQQEEWAAKLRSRGL